jgi:hypothetical protein
MSPSQNGGLYRFAFYAVMFRSSLSMDIFRKHDQRQTLPEESS